MSSLAPTTELQGWLDRLQLGDDAAAGELVCRSEQRLRTLVRFMLRRDFARLRRFEDSDDVLIEAQLKLHRSLAEVKPATVRDYYALAATQIRRVLLDLARSYFGKEGPGGRHQSPPGGQLPSSWLARGSSGDDSPLTLADWSEFHDRVTRLPPELREVLELLFYLGLTQPQAAEVLGVSAKTIQRRWFQARAALCDM